VKVHEGGFADAAFLKDWCIGTHKAASLGLGSALGDDDRAGQAAYSLLIRRRWMFTCEAFDDLIDRLLFARESIARWGASWVSVSSRIQSSSSSLSLLSSDEPLRFLLYGGGASVELDGWFAATLGGRPSSALAAALVCLDS